MEGKEAIIGAILSSARDAAANMISDAESERAELFARVDSEADTARSEAIEKAESDAVMLKSRRRKLAELDARKILLAAKRQVIEKAYAQAVTKILNMTDNVYRDFIGGLVSCYAEDGDEIIISERDVKRLHYDWAEELSKKRNMNLSLSHKFHAGRGGVILTNERYDKNLTLERLVEETRSVTETAVTEKLFKR